MTLLTDRELIAAASQGKVAAFASLIGRYRDVRTRFAMRMLGDSDAADEALLASYLRAFQTIGRYKEPEKVEDWLFRIVVSECRARALRRAVRAPRPSGEVDALADWRAAVEGSEGGADVQRALDQIDPINREAFILQYIEELSYPQIAALTGASVVTLERQVDRACARLRELLPEWQKDSGGGIPGLGASLGSVVPSFAVRVSQPLRRPEVLNPSFEDRLMTKLLRASDAPAPATSLSATESKTNPTPTMSAEPKTTPSPILPPSPATLPEPTLFTGLSLPRLTRFAPAAIALAAAIVSFATGYGIRGRRDAHRVAAATAKPKSTAAKIVRRTDTVRVVRGDTVLVARFVRADANAKSVALIGDFNRWDPAATPLTRAGAGTWTRTLRLTAGRHEYAFLVDGKRWVTDGGTRSSHDAFDVQSSVLTASAGASAAGESGAASARLKKMLPRRSADRVLAAISSARGNGLPAAALENRALKFAARNVPASDIEDAIVADAEAMGRAARLLAAAGRSDPSAEEIDATAQLLGEGADSARIVALAKSTAANRSLETPLRVSAELAATNEKPGDALDRVDDRLRKGATDGQLEQLLDGASTRVVAKSKPTSTVRQAGTPAKSTTSNTAKKKPSSK